MITQPLIRPSQPQSIGEVLDTSFRLYRASIGSVWPLCLLLVVAGSLSTIYMFLHGGFPVPTATDPLAAFAMFKDSTYWMIYLLGIALMLWAMGALCLKEHAIGSGEDMPIPQALQLSLGRIVTLLLLSILFGVAIAIGTALLIIPGLILMVSLTLGWNIALIEGRGPLQSLSDSHALVWGHWWRTAAILTVAVIILTVLYFAVAMVIGVAAPLLVNVQSVALFGLVSGLLIGVGVNVLVMPYYIALLLAIYWDLKLRKQGGDLAARVGALGTA